VTGLFLGTFVGASLSSGAQVAGKFVPSYYVTDALASLFLRGAPLASYHTRWFSRSIGFLRCYLGRWHSAVREVLQNL